MQKGPGGGPAGWAAAGQGGQSHAVMEPEQLLKLQAAENAEAQLFQSARACSYAQITNGTAWAAGMLGGRIAALVP